MATVHPSRMGLVPQDLKDIYPETRRGGSPSPTRRYDRDRRKKDGKMERTGGRESDYDGESRRGWGGERERERIRDRRDRGWDHDNNRASPRRKDNRGREDSQDEDRGRYHKREGDRNRDRSRSRRRASPEYGDYKRPASPGLGEAPSMYPNRQPRDGPYERRSGYGSGSNEYLENRRAQREGSTFSIWPPSPKAPVRALSPERGSSRKKSKRDRSETPTESSDSELERRRRERKERKRARKEKGEKKGRRERKRRSRSYDTEEEDHSRDRDRNQRNEDNSRPQSPSRSLTPSSSRISDDEEEWVEKPAVVAPFVMVPPSNGIMPPPTTIPSRIEMNVDEDADDDSDMDVGPQPLMKMNTSRKVDERAYGGALLRGEGSAMAAFLKDDTQTRIPRRGEIGLTSDEIAQFESVGYVMSGSRHKRMNAVRIRKENQVISAEEKRSILKLQKEERERREAILREEFSELVQEKLKGPETKRTVT